MTRVGRGVDSAVRGQYCLILYHVYEVKINPVGVGYVHATLARRWEAS